MCGDMMSAGSEPVLRSADPSQEGVTWLLGERNDARSQTDVRDHLNYDTDDSIRRLFFVDFAYEQEQRVHGECPTSEFLPNGSRSCRRHRDSGARLSSSRRFSGSPFLAYLVRAHRSTRLCDLHLGGLLFLDAAASGNRAKRSSKIDLCGLLFWPSRSSHWPSA